jgi:hypothetical protein
MCTVQTRLADAWVARRAECSLLPLESAAWARSGQPEANACSYTRLHVEPSIAIQSAPGGRFETSCFLQAFIRH